MTGGAIRSQQILTKRGKMKSARDEKAKRMLGRATRSNEESIVATAESLMRLGLLKNSPTKTP